MILETEMFWHVRNVILQQDNYMRPELDKYLCNKYPLIFKDRNAPMNKTCMCWGFPDDGWFFIIESLCDQIQTTIDRNNKRVKKYEEEESKLITQVVATQVKEKFGGLRFYVDGGNEDIYTIIHAYESLSYTVCELCGKMDETVICTGRGWFKTLCYECRKPEEKDIHMLALKKYSKDKLKLFKKIKAEKK